MEKLHLIQKDRKGAVLKLGDSVLWYDPELSARDLSRVWKIYEITDSMVKIYDCYGEAEVFASELEKTRNIKFQARDIDTGEMVTGDLVYTIFHKFGKAYEIKPMLVTMLGHGGLMWAKEKHVIDESTLELLTD